MDENLKRKIKERLRQNIGNFDLTNPFQQEELKTIIEKMILVEKKDSVLEEASALAYELADEVLGLGPVGALLRDPAISQIMINGPQDVYIEKGPAKLTSQVKFADERQVATFIERIMVSTHRSVSVSQPYVDLTLLDGLRLNIILPPLVKGGPKITIRKPFRKISSIDDLIQMDTLDSKVGEFLVAAIRARANIIFSGATNSGKTTLLNTLSSYISPEERIVTIEDTIELQLKQPHIIQLETRRPNFEGNGLVTAHDLFKNSLRMSPDRIILGELRGEEAFEALQAMCSGHLGTLAILHAKSPWNAVNRLLSMILTALTSFNPEAIYQQIADGLNLIVQLEQFPDGSRKVTRVTQVSGVVNKRMALEDLFYYQMRGFSKNGRAQGDWVATGARPNFIDLFKKFAVPLPDSLFGESFFKEAADIILQA